MKTIVIFGKKQSGKDSLAKAIMGYKLVQEGVIPSFDSDENGNCRIVYDRQKNEGLVFTNEEWNNENIDHYSKYFFPYVRCRNFAAALKSSLSDLFGLDISKLYGTNDEKNEETHIIWKNMRALASQRTRRSNKDRDPESKMTYREIMEIFGTDICRKMDDPCHVRSTYNFLKNSGTNLGLIADGRFDNEFEFFADMRDCVKIKLLRSPFESEALSENGLTIDHSKFDLVIDNQEMSMADKIAEAINFLVKKNFLNKTGIETTKL